MPPDGSTRVNEPRGRLIALSPNTQAVHSRRDLAERRIEQTHCWIICALSLIVGGGRRYRVRCLPNAVEMRASCFRRSDEAWCSRRIAGRNIYSSPPFAPFLFGCRFVSIDTLLIVSSSRFADTTTSAARQQNQMKLRSRASKSLVSQVSSAVQCYCVETFYL